MRQTRCMSNSEAPQCTADTATGERCTHPTTDPSGVCGRHTGTATQAPAATGGPALTLDDPTAVPASYTGPHFLCKKNSPRQAEAAEKIHKALTFMYYTSPYLSIPFGSLRTVWGGVETMGVDHKGRMYVNPDFVADLDTLEVAGSLLHEANHLLRAHDVRSPGEPSLHKLWNLAADYEINQDIRGTEEVCDDTGTVVIPANPGVDNAVLPKMCVSHEDCGLPPGQTAEWYFTEVAKKAREQQQQQKGEGEEGDGSGSGEGSGSGKGSGSGEGSGSGDGEEGDGSGSGKGSGSGEGEEGDGSGSGHSGVGCGDCGSVVTGANNEDLEDLAKSQGQPGVDDYSIESVRDRTAEAIEEHARAKGQGSIPAGLARWAAGHLRPQVDWRRRLRSVVSSRVARAKMGSRRVTYEKRHKHSRPVQRGQAQVVRPGQRFYTPRVSVVIDTSGSMGQGDVAAAVAEATEIVRKTKSEISVISCDAQPGEVQRVRRTSDHIHLTGGGGTDMRIGIDEAMKAKEKPDVVIVLSDGFTPWPDRKISAELIIGLVTQGSDEASLPETPEWAKTIPITTE